MTKKILITGFEPFDNAFVNPTQEWIHWMKNQNISSDRVVESLVLPVTFQEGFLRVKSLYESFKPDIIILTGLAQNRTQLTIERIGINWVDARIPDNAGVKICAQKINEDAPDGLFTTLEIDKAQKIVAETGEVLKISTSAGEYVCNDVLYKTLLYTQHSGCKCTFIHFPHRDNYDGIYLALLALVNRL